MSDDIRRACRARENLVAQLQRTCPGAAIGITRVGDDYGLCVDLPRPADRRIVPTSVDGHAVQVRLVGRVTASRPWADGDVAPEPPRARTHATRRFRAVHR